MSSDVMWGMLATSPDFIQPMVRGVMKYFDPVVPQAAVPFRR